MVGIESIAVAVSVIVVVSLAVWCLYTLTKLDYAARAERSAAQRALYEAKRDAALYKIEPAEQFAVPHKPIEATVWAALKEEGASILFDPKQPPKRKYTKRSSFWTAKRKKAAASKAKKKTRKSK